MTTGDEPWSDDELLSRLHVERSAVDRPPEDLAEVALRALTWDTGFAQLIAAADTGEPVLARGPVSAVAGSEVIDNTFEADGSVLEISIETLPDGPGHRLSGLVHPRRDEVQVLSPGAEPTQVECDSFGRFEAEITAKLVAIAFELPDGRLVRTPLLDLP